MSENVSCCRRPYRSRRGMILGVCRGLAEYLGMPVLLVRLIAVLALFATGFWPTVGLYLLAGLLMKPKPEIDPQGPEEEEFYDFDTRRPDDAVDALKRRFDAVERRIRRVEDAAVSRERDWDRRFHAG